MEVFVDSLRGEFGIPLDGGERPFFRQPHHVDELFDDVRLERRAVVDVGIDGRALPVSRVRARAALAELLEIDFFVLRRSA